MSNAAYIENGVDGITVLVKYCSLGWQSLRHVGTHTRIFRVRLYTLDLYDALSHQIVGIPST